MEIQKQTTLDILDTKAPALSSISDMPVIETKPDASPPAAPAIEEKIDGTTPEKSAPPEKPEEPSASDEPEGKPKARGVQKRLDELTREREEARRLAEAERQEKLRLLALLEDRGRPSKPVTEDDKGPERPLRSAFAENPDAYDAAMDNYIEAKSAWQAKREVKAALDEQERKAQQKAIEDGEKSIREAYAGRVTKAIEKYPDYKDVAESPEVMVSIPMAHAILHSEHGPDIAYHLGKNLAEAERISKLAAPLQLVELGLIVASLKGQKVDPKVETKVEAKAETVEAVKPPISNAPKPIKPLGAGSDPTAKSPEEETMEEYAARRKKELQAERRPGRTH